MNSALARPTALFVPLTTLFFLLGAACSSDVEVGRTESALAAMPPLGATETYAILAGSTVTSTGPSMIIGDVGVSPGSALTGFPPATVTGGSIHLADGPAAAAQADLTVAYNNLAAQPCDTVLTGMDLGGMTLMPAVYCFSTSAQLTGTLTLDGMGNPNAVFVFQVGSTLTTGSSSAVNMIGGAIAGRVFWQIGSSATLGTGTRFSGNILAQESITATTGSDIAGRALARIGAVTIASVTGQAVMITPSPTDLDAAVDAAIPDSAILDAAIPDSAVLDAAIPDSAILDAAIPDSAILDAAIPDSAILDAAIPDSAILDAAIPDSAILDAALPDARILDAALPDAAIAPDAAVVRDAAVAMDAAVERDAGNARDAGRTPDAGTVERPDGGRVADSHLGGVAGGAQLGDCSVSSSTPGGGGGGGAAFWLLAVFGLVAIRRRRDVLALLALVALMLPAVASADSITLDQFHPAETSEDGIEVSRPIDLGHHRVGATAYLEWAHEPLVYESVAGESDTQFREVVRHQLALHMGMAYGLVDRVVLFGGFSANLLMVGSEVPGFLTADGTRFGDTLLGVRVRLLGTPRLGGATYGALGIQLGLTLPTAHWLSPTSQLSGESGVMLVPELLGEVGGRYLRLTLNMGARIRSIERFDSLTVGSELTWGAGLGVPLGGRTFELDLETYGSTTFDNPMSRNTTPAEAIAGVRWRAESGWTAALGAGPGLVRGYGSPDFRAIASVGWTEPAHIAERVEVAIPPMTPPPDWDEDGVIDSEDRCPRVPGPPDNHGCARFVSLAPTEVAPVEIVVSQRIEFDTDESSTLRDVSAPILEEVRALLEANPQLLRIAIEGHADERASDEHNMGLSQRRADAVRNWLIEHGIDPARLEARGYGEREPFDPGQSPTAQQINRNVQFFILDPPASRPAR